MELRIKNILTFKTSERCARTMIIFLVGMLVGCGDGGGENTFGQPGTGTPFTGRLIGTLNHLDHTLPGMDLESGRFMSLPGNDFFATDFFATNGAFDSNGDVNARRDPRRPSI